jgi:NAD(P)-dependent dehydrogenase (short-subunit alcohol dehydrogenase family)
MDCFNGKRVYITGGSSGIGLEAACELASSGAHVAIFAR